MPAPMNGNMQQFFTSNGLWTNYTWGVLALMMWREARGQGIEGMRAVGHVAHNRSRIDSKDLCKVIVQDAQFSSINPPNKTYDPNLDVWPANEDEEFRQALILSYKIMNYLDPDNTNGAYYYSNKKYITPGGWYQRNVIDKRLKEVAVIGDHVFHHKTETEHRLV